MKINNLPYFPDELLKGKELVAQRAGTLYAQESNRRTITQEGHCQ
jgi:hypothetical protein